MKYRRNLIFVLLLISIFIFVGCSKLGVNQGSNVAEDVPVKVEVDFRSPDFTLTNLEGNQLKLSEFVGEKVLFINFWATWCPPCRSEMPSIQEIHEENRDEVKVLAVNVKESRTKVSEFINKEGYDFTVLLDKTGEVANTYLVRGIPKTVVVDKRGVIKAVHVGSMNKEQMKKIINKAL
jgi:DsbE subfamily thiol:disulfide oxidoreductase